MTATEVNFDGLVGQTHNYAGLSPGNLASNRHAGELARPRAAARQGLDKMKLLADLGFAQAVLPPLERPDVRTLRRLGFRGDDAEVIRAAARQAPLLLAACTSASAMWTANAATVSPSADTHDGRIHITPANLVSNFHRSIEPDNVTHILRAVFADTARFAVHDPLPATGLFADEGAANHARLGHAHDEPAVELFIYGDGDDEAPPEKAGAAAIRRKHLSRQTAQASRAIARLHGLAPERVVLGRQNPEAIESGVFHNDVICTGNLNLLLFHEDAFIDADPFVAEIRERVGEPFHVIKATTNDFSIDDAVGSYLFNAQILSRPDRTGMLLLAPLEARQTPAVHDFIKRRILDADNPVDEARFVDVRESMRNGGGPACLRLRVVMTEPQRAAVRPRVFLDDALYNDLAAWIDRHYREELAPPDLADPGLLAEVRHALAELTDILDLGPIYPFQQPPA